jgi:hypothetical protein
MCVCVFVCLCVRVTTTPINFWMSEPVFIKFGMYTIVPELISKAYFINPSHQSVCLYVYPTLFLGNGSVKRYRGNEYTSNEREFSAASYQRQVGDYFFTELPLIFST